MTDDRGIAEARDAFVAALERGDVHAASKVYVEGARLLAPSAEIIEGRAAIEAFWSAGLRMGIRAVELEVLDVEQDEGLACEFGRYLLRLEPREGGSVVDRGQYVLVHRRQQDGTWLRAVEMFNPDAPSTVVGARPAEEGRIDARLRTIP